MKFQKGQSGNPNGRPAGKPNKMTTAARDAFMFAFDKIGGPQNLAEWAKENQTEFYRLFSKLIPVDVNFRGAMSITLTREDVRKLPQDKIDRIRAGEPVEAVLADGRN